MKAAIFTSVFFDYDGEEQRIGGVEIYLHNLAQLCIKMNIKPIIFQFAHSSFERIIDNIRIVGLPVLKKSEYFRIKEMRIKAFKLASKEFDIGNDIVIFGADRHSIRFGSNRCVSIQHGISWDLPNYLFSSRKIFRNGLVGPWYKMILQQRAIRDFERCQNRVCVDYNFLNWYRTFLWSEPTGNNWIIPNFTEIPNGNTFANVKRDVSVLKILFARRFCEYRGTRIMAQATLSLLKKYPQTFFTFAGEGPDESWLRTQFAGEPRVFITRYLHDQVVDVHLQHDIAVVPSIASEGTSLSVAEAMACGCAVVATSIGGITNMIIDGYNGRLCMPTAGELEKCIEELIIDCGMRMQISKNAYETARSAFSKDKWEKSWRLVLNTIANM